LRQAIAIDERRRMFRIDRWVEPQEYKPNPFNAERVRPQDIKQVWFAGVHADIGGGYPETATGPAQYPLGWLIDEAVLHGLQINRTMYNHLVLGQGRQGGSRTYAQPSVTAKLHNSMNWAWLLLEGLPKRAKWRDWPKQHSLLGWYLPWCEPRRINDGARVHHSVFERVDADATYRPPNLPPRHRLQIENSTRTTTTPAKPT
jgi:uncharacterized protein (DUF2235 family)